MYVTLPQALVISEYFNFDQFGEIVLHRSTARTPRPRSSTGPAAISLAAEQALERITLDDGRSRPEPRPRPPPQRSPFTLDNSFRGGDTFKRPA